ncbi:uncharacterized protein LOC127663204 [Xyrauchen texanus]|uniref:uncharacterized protein LOC127663204 n=1 Tax=Xyrauchen texanus TaxID=154827 RepID=UPI002242739D|nr:uncharacterized protein LOC127663204 [Xyrauchen texanus]
MTVVLVSQSDPENRFQSSNLKQHSHSSAGIGLFWKLDVREMLFIFGLLLLLIPTDTCVEMFCRFNQTDPCYAALGHKLYLQMVTDTRDQELGLYKWINNTFKSFITVEKNKIVYEHESIIHRSEFIINNRTLIINRVIRTDSGTYRLEIYDSNGSVTHDVYLPVIVEVECSVSVVFVVVWSLEMMLLLTLLGGFHIYIRYSSTHTSGRKQEEEIAL